MAPRRPRRLLRGTGRRSRPRPPAARTVGRRRAVCRSARCSSRNQPSQDERGVRTLRSARSGRSAPPSATGSRPRRKPPWRSLPDARSRRGSQRRHMRRTSARYPAAGARAPADRSARHRPRLESDRGSAGAALRGEQPTYRYLAVLEQQDPSLRHGAVTARNYRLRSTPFSKNALERCRQNLRNLGFDGFEGWAPGRFLNFEALWRRWLDPHGPLIFNLALKNRFLKNAYTGYQRNLRNLRGAGERLAGATVLDLRQRLRQARAPLAHWASPCIGTGM